MANQIMTQGTDLSGIKKVTTQGEVQAYSLPVYRTMTLRDGTEAEVLVQLLTLTREQLENSIKQLQAQLEDLKSKLEAINKLEE